jgi:hypothetical protein
MADYRAPSHPQPEANDRPPGSCVTRCVADTGHLTYNVTAKHSMTLG